MLDMSIKSCPIIHWFVALVKWSPTLHQMIGLCLPWVGTWLLFNWSLPASISFITLAALLLCLLTICYVLKQQLTSCRPLMSHSYICRRSPLSYCILSTLTFSWTCFNCHFLQMSLRLSVCPSVCVSLCLKGYIYLML